MFSSGLVESFGRGTNWNTGIWCPISQYPASQSRKGEKLFACPERDRKGEGALSHFTLHLVTSCDLRKILRIKIN